MFKQSTTFIVSFTTFNVSGAAADADALPTATLVKNGVDTSVTLTVAKIDTGRYKVTGTIPADYLGGDSISIAVSATIGGIAAKNVIVNSFVDRGLDMTQLVPTTNTPQSVGDALNAARADGFGRWEITGSTVKLYAADGTTVVRTLTNVGATGRT